MKNTVKKKNERATLGLLVDAVSILKDIAFLIKVGRISYGFYRQIKSLLILIIKEMLGLLEQLHCKYQL